MSHPVIDPNRLPGLQAELQELNPPSVGHAPQEPHSKLRKLY